MVAATIGGCADAAAANYSVETGLRVGHLTFHGASVIFLDGRTVPSEGFLDPRSNLAMRG